MLRKLTEQMDRGMLSITLDADFCISAVNQGFADTLGYWKDQLLGRPMSEIVPPYVPKLASFRNFNQAVARFEPVSDDYRYLQGDGGPLVWLNAQWFPVRGEDGTLACVQDYVRDLSKSVEDAKRARLSLRR